MDINPEGGPMKKTFVMFFLLGLMVSCASQQERSVSSIDEADEPVQQRHVHPTFEPRASFR